MDLKRLSIFLKLSETLHFARTANELGMAQSALSRQMSLLEKELECRLLDRSNRWKVTLTPAGVELLAQGRQILDAVARSESAVRSAARGETGILVLALNSSALNMECLLQTFHKIRVRYSGIVLKIQEEPSGRVYEMVRANQADVGLLRITPVADPEFGMKLLAMEKLVLAIPENHVLAQKRNLTLHDFRREQFILPGGNDAPLHRAVFDQLCRDAGFTPRIAQEIESLTTILRILPAQNAVSLVLKSYIGKMEHVVFRKLPGTAAALPETVMWRKNNNSSVLKIFLRNLMSKQNL